MLDPSFLDPLLGPDDASRAARYPGSATGRQPVHTVYVPADRFDETTVGEWGGAALAALDEHGPLPDTDADLEARVRAKLAAEPIEDVRIDFEDGYGVREDDDEDAAARASADAIGRAGAPAFVGIRMKSLEGPTRRRAIRTLELFLDALAAAGPLPLGFRVTLPKVTSVAQVEAMVRLCEALEVAYALPSLRFEIQIETPQAVIGPDGAALVAPMIHAAAGRCAGLHFGTYDYTASLGIAAAYQAMDHPAADHAKAMMQVAAAGTGVPLSDGSTNVIPVGDRDAVQAAWALHARLVRRSLEHGFYQGWDLHPAQLPTRFAATFRFFRDNVDLSAARLRAYLERVDTGVLDEPATARALAGFLLRGVHCGAFEVADIERRTGLRDIASLQALAHPGG
jgi:citrate lyase beta subunit